MPYKVVFRKTHDYLLFSLFEKISYKFNERKEIYEAESTKRYKGFLLNFYELKIINALYAILQQH